MTKLFTNGDFKEFKAAVENKKATLMICETNKTSFGLLIVDPIIFKKGQLSSSSLISAFNILDRKEFTGKGDVNGCDNGEWGGKVNIGVGEVAIFINGKGKYIAYSNSGGEILEITEDGDGVNAITKEEGNDGAYFNKLEVYA